jgi:ferredoxin
VSGRAGRRAGRRDDRASRGAQAEPAYLRVNPIACAAHGLCTELLPELIRADPWGYPLIAPGPVPPGLMPAARRAVTACPTLALLLSPAERPVPDLAGPAESGPAEGRPPGGTHPGPAGGPARPTG